jgi:hypothetical protein
LDAVEFEAVLEACARPLQFQQPADAQAHQRAFALQAARQEARLQGQPFGVNQASRRDFDEAVGVGKA